MLKKLLILTLAVGLLFGSQLPAQAALQEYDEAIIAPGQNQEKYIHNSLESMMLGATAFIVGHNEVNNSFETVSEVKRERGLVGDMGYAIALMYENKPADTQTFVADALNSAGIVTPAQAQGLGFASLSPLLNTWKVFRNIAYLFFVVVFLIIGFLIMLRQKINGQTVVTAQQAIPRVIIALLLVTFSYAIAGLLIDLMYLTMYFLLAIFGQGNTEGQAEFLNKNFLTLGFKMMAGGFDNSREVVSVISEEIGSDFKTMAGETVENILGFTGGIVLGVVIAFTVAFKVFKLFFELLKTYASIILAIAFSPIILMMGAVPGKNTFSEWIKSLIGNLSAFPIVLLVLLIFEMLTGGILGGSAEVALEYEAGGFMPPYLVGNRGAGGLSTFIVGFGMLLIIDELVKKGKEVMGAKPGIFDQFAGNVGDAFKTSWEGGNLIPGLNLPIFKQLGGLSGKNITQKTAIGAYGLGRGVIGAYGNMIHEGAATGSAVRGFLRGSKRGLNRASETFSDEQVPKFSNWVERRLKGEPDPKNESDKSSQIPENNPTPFA